MSNEMDVAIGVAPVWRTPDRYAAMGCLNSTNSLHALIPGMLLPMELRPPEFEPMFRPGTRYRWPDVPEGVIEVVDGGMLHLATGRLVACDPFWGSTIERWCDPFTVTVAPGRYPVTLSGVRWDPALHPRALPPIPRGAAAKLTIRDEPPVTWELALRPGEDPATLQPDEFFGFGVDSGKGCFLDASAVPAMSRSP
jgi:Protein of unknown function (DUF4241)